MSNMAKNTTGSKHYSTNTDAMKRQIRNAAEGVYNNTNGCMSFQEVAWDDPGVSNYVYVESYSGCSSYVGMIGGPQRMSLIPACFEHGTIMHEFLHATGIYHEHTRSDRDDWVIIHWDNIMEGTEYNFVKKIEDVTGDTLDAMYDYDSIMHYCEDAFAVDPSKPTISTINPPGADIGQRADMSPLDSEKVQILYGCLALEDSSFKGWTMDDIFAVA